MAEIYRIGGDGPRAPNKEPDAHGQAALMLAESILHTLVETGTVTNEGALSIVQTAREVKEEIGKGVSERPALIAESVRLLDQIATTFRSDLN